VYAAARFAAGHSRVAGLPARGGDVPHKVASRPGRPAEVGAPHGPTDLAEIRDAEDRDHAVRAAHVLAHEFGAKWPKAVAKIVDDLDALLAFFDFPAEHWIHLKSTNPIESAFSTVRLRTRVAKGAGSRAAGLAMAFKLIESAQQRWRAVNGPHLVALVRADAIFEQGMLIERPNQQDQEAAA
jgi:putative transposase